MNSRVTVLLYIVALFGVLIIFVCGAGVVRPEVIISLVERWVKPAGLVIAVVTRIVLGIAAILGAPDSTLPVFLHIVGGISLVAAATLAMIGVSGYRRIVDWTRSIGGLWIRVWLFAGLLFGTSLVWVSGIVKW